MSVSTAEHGKMLANLDSECLEHEARLVERGTLQHYISPRLALESTYRRDKFETLLKLQGAASLPPRNIFRTNTSISGIERGDSSAVSSPPSYSGAETDVSVSLVLLARDGQLSPDATGSIDGFAPRATCVVIAAG